MSAPRMPKRLCTPIPSGRAADNAAENAADDAADNAADDAADNTPLPRDRSGDLCTPIPSGSAATSGRMCDSGRKPIATYGSAIAGGTAAEMRIARLYVGRSQPDLTTLHSYLPQPSVGWRRPTRATRAREPKERIEQHAERSETERHRKSSFLFAT